MSSTYLSSDVLMGICCSLSILGAVQPSSPASLLHHQLQPLVKLLNRAAREVCATAQNAQMHQQHYKTMAMFNRCVFVWWGGV
jgi:hypothetical protein